jgi:hypothetical protein
MTDRATAIEEQARAAIRLADMGTGPLVTITKRALRELAEATLAATMEAEHLRAVLARLEGHGNPGTK